MTKPKTYTTPAGRVLTDDDLDAIANDVERTDYDVEQLKLRRRHRRLPGPERVEVVPVRLDPELKRAFDARAEAEQLSSSEMIRRALRRYLEVA